MLNKIVLGVWCIILLMASMSLYVFVHEATHVVRIESPQMMCVGFSDEYIGMVTHNNFYSESYILKEEVIANLVAGIVVLLFIFLTYYILKNIKGGE